MHAVSKMLMAVHTESMEFCSVFLLMVEKQLNAFYIKKQELCSFVSFDAGS